MSAAAMPAAAAMPTSPLPIAPAAMQTADAVPTPAALPTAAGTPTAAVAGPVDPTYRSQYVTGEEAWKMFSSVSFFRKLTGC